MSEYIEPLKPCPFCGSKAEIRKVYGTENEYYVECNSSRGPLEDRCIISGVGVRAFNSKDEAIAAWNRRVK
jgi:Lar family restriction alleviation protein